MRGTNLLTFVTEFESGVLLSVRALGSLTSILMIHNSSYTPRSSRPTEHFALVGSAQPQSSRHGFELIGSGIFDPCQGLVSGNI
jgi:hypothetical protein